MVNYPEGAHQRLSDRLLVVPVENSINAAPQVEGWRPWWINTQPGTSFFGDPLGWKYTVDFEDGADPSEFGEEKILVSDS